MTDLFGPLGKICRKCLEFKQSSEYYLNRNRLHPYCKPCAREKARTVYSNDPDKYRERIRRYSVVNREENIARGEAFYYSERGRALNLFKSAQVRSVKKGWDFNLSRDDLLEMIRVGKCAVTGIPFVHEKPVGTVKNPYAASIDRIDSSKPYEKDNIRLVIWQYNLMKGEISDKELYKLCKKVVEYHEK